MNCPIKLIADPLLNYDEEIKGYNLTCIIKETQKLATPVIENTIESNKLDQSFLSNLFHDILTPINVITGFVQELSESIEKPSDDQAESIKYIKDNQQLLLQIMDNAVEYSNLEQDHVELTPEPIVFVELLEDIEKEIEKLSSSKDISFTYGKISSSLKFFTDKQKFNTFVSLFSRFALVSTEQSKVYLSAYQNTSDKFIICLRDERASITNEFLKNMNDILSVDESIIKQKFGISRFAIRLFKRLIILLNAEKKILQQDNINAEFAFEFPMTLEVSEISDTENKVSKTSEPEVVIEETTENVQVPLTQAIEETSEKSHTAVEPQNVHETPSLSDNQSQSINVNVNLQTPPKEPEEPKVEIVSGPVSENVVEVESQSVHSENTIITKNIKELSCLYVEDQVDSQILFKVQMKDLKSVEFATSFEKALPLIQLKQFDFIVMDINLQGEYNGLDALRAIQKMPGLSDIPIIAVTAYVLPGDREKFIAAGFTDFITKPILRDKLENVLKKIFVTA
jgi:CheY-like chemotaxis protein